MHRKILSYCLPVSHRTQAVQARLLENTSPSADVLFIVSSDKRNCWKDIGSTSLNKAKREPTSVKHKTLPVQRQDVRTTFDSIMEVDAFSYSAGRHTGEKAHGCAF